MMAKSGIKTEKVVEVTETSTKVTLTLDDKEERVLQLNSDEGIDLYWDALSFRKLSEAAQRKLSLGNLKRYLAAEREVEERAEAAKRSVVSVDPFNPVQGYAASREFIRPRRGWHLCWKNPGREFDAAMAGPYKQVRKPTEAQEKAGYEPGEENGEILKRLDGEGKVEAIAVECPEELYQAHLQWCDEESTRRHRGLTTTFASHIEEINRKTTRSDARIVPMENGKPIS